MIYPISANPLRHPVWALKIQLALATFVDPLVPLVDSTRAGPFIRSYQGWYT